MRSTRAVPVAVSLLALAALACLAPAADLDETKLGLIRPRMQRFVEDQVISGAVTVVGTSKGVVGRKRPSFVHHLAVGDLRIEPKEPMTWNALFRIASMTKPITAVGIMILAEEGKLAVTDPVEKHLSEFRGQMMVNKGGKGDEKLKKPSRPITLRDLLTHTSGLPFYPSEMGLYKKRDVSLEKAVAAVAKLPLDFEPGSRWAYCNSGIDTLGRVIEILSGQNYESFLQKRIFEPLGMTSTTFRPSKEQMKHLAGLYASKNGKLVLAPNTLLGPPADARHPIPAGGLFSTGDDQARFYRMMLNGGSLDGKRILSPESVKAMTSVQTGELKCGFPPSVGMGWGYGFGVVRKPEGVTAMLSPGTFGHGGAYGTQAWADPKRDLFAILLIQRTDLRNSDQSEIRGEFQRLAFEAVKP
jgi:CubicO group peptidase (beta-lactamase class C family)